MAKVQPILKKHHPQILVTGHGDIALTHREILQRQSDAYAYIHALRRALQKGATFDFEELMEAYDFPKIMKAFHDGNVALMKKELSNA